MRPDKILMCPPDYFTVEYEGNMFMDLKNPPDIRKAKEQWNNLKLIYTKLGFEVILIPPAKGFPDMVFTANQSFPFVNENGKLQVILSKMKNSQRKDEVKYFKDFYEQRGYEILNLPEEIEFFESMGDAIMDYKRNIIFGGYGQRSQREAYRIIENYTGLEVVTLELINPYLYHLDTCFSILDNNNVVIDETAFSSDDLKKIQSYFKNVIVIDRKENMNSFACNCHCPDGKNVIVQSGADNFTHKLQTEGFNIIETDTSEFIKSGGSVFCMKMMLW
ncbi:hypothetical protein FBQ84_02600 [Ignavibacteria bacterium CHB1]|nr:MAG: hypothetical protein EDM69_03865 [Chlorobiota bacterium]MBV6398266.1 N(G),N(G)-dimethylarginine dimethylaminohydrolase [Ignavibacteria bacterium]MCC6886141.1 hypothetical protein [Ignavibacteriales bacterium]MCE7952607.1 hypothetical protein [Chlorobi bacterium CHB7]MDL1886719.1 hypothetical protein [Ignavibacteria bacterium CHB1]RIK50246.1 MAG: hypothetical protein DCC60_00140 [Ignavibacteriota bacterium]